MSWLGHIARALGLMVAVAPLLLFPQVAGRTNGAQQADLVVVQAPRVAWGSLAGRFPEGSQLVRLTPASHSPLLLTPNFFAAADPRISFDGSRLLAAVQETAAARWQIWEMDADGSGLRQITHCGEDCLKPAYLPRGEIVFTAVAADATSQLWVSKLDGSDAHPITFGPGDFQVETVLMNGMILASAGSPLAPATAPRGARKGNAGAGSASTTPLPPPYQGGGSGADRELYVLRPDGSGLASFRCDHEHPAIRSEAQELADGSVVFVKSPLGSAGAGAELAWIRRGEVHNASLTAPGGAIISAAPLSAEKLAVAREVSFAPGNPVLNHEGASGKFALFAFDVTQGKFAEVIYEDPKLSSLAAEPVAAHEPPRWYWSTLNPALKRGYFICLDSYLAGDAPRGRLGGVIAKARVLALESERGSEHSQGATREIRLGEAPVEKDGSFYIAVPPDQPVRFELLDARGRVVRAQRSWIWARSGEEHGCVGCHEDRALAPENRWPLALRRFDTPTRLDAGK